MLDLEYLRSHPHLLPTLLMHQRITETPVGGGSICQARRLTLDDGASVFVKSWAGSPVPPGFFAAEAAGLTWLRDAQDRGGASVPEVLAALPELLVLQWVDHAAPSAAAAERFGRELAATHRAGADSFGAPWPGYIGSLPQDNTQSSSADAVSSDATPWWEWYAQRRILPYLQLSASRQALSDSDVAVVDRVVGSLERLAPPPEPPARLHGDLWYGNVLWAADRVWLVDPAAHGGHRETDLAQLALFGGAPQLERILAAYDEAWPLAPGWRVRVPLHQLHLLLVHAALFGAGYRDAVLAAAGAALRA